MPYTDNAVQIQKMREWRRKREERNKLKAKGYTNEEIKLLEQTLYNKKWRMSHLYQIRDIKGLLRTFTPNRAQAEFIANAHNRNLILKSRQLGFTTYECIDELDDALFNENFNALLIFHTKIAAEDSFRNKITVAWENLPDKIQKKFIVDTDKAGEFRFQHGKGIYSSIACRTSGVSGTFSRLHVSEFGLMCEDEPAKAEELVAATFPALPSGARVDIESTARGNSGLFHDMYMEALNRKTKPLPSQFKAHFFNWTYDDKEIDKIKEARQDIPQQLREYQKKYNLTDIQITYYYNKLEEKGLPFDLAFKKMKSEYPTTIEEAFEGSGEKLFDADVINNMINTQVKSPITEVNNWRYFDNYRPNHKYGIGVDVAEGVGQDSSAIVVIDFEYEQAKVVATYENNKIAPDILAYEIRNIARAFGNPIVAVESNNKGGTTLNELKGIYKNLYTFVRKDKLTNEETEKLGWETNGKTKPLMFYGLSTACEENQFVCPDVTLLREMLSYDKGKLNKLKSEKGETQHWDKLTAACIAYQMKDHAKPCKEKKVKKENKEFDKYAVI